MSRLDLVFERARKLPQERQDAIAAELEFLLDAPPAAPPVLSPEQEAELQRRLTAQGKDYISHEDVAARFEAKFRR